ncbi:hypothetical protein [Acrocarpospora macrocephala]|nr:hypothetical protein [Acrocarpospora macrocephala]
MTDDRRAEIQQRREALDLHATAGEWRYLGDDCVLVFPDDGGMAENVASITVWGEAGSEEESALGEFISHAKDDIPDLLAEVARQKAVIDVLAARVGHDLTSSACLRRAELQAGLSPTEKTAPIWDGPCETCTALAEVNGQ